MGCLILAGVLRGHGWLRSRARADLLGERAPLSHSGGGAGHGAPGWTETVRVERETAHRGAGSERRRHSDRTGGHRLSWMRSSRRDETGDRVLPGEMKHKDETRSRPGAQRTRCPGEMGQRKSPSWRKWNTEMEHDPRPGRAACGGAEAGRTGRRPANGNAGHGAATEVAGGRGPGAGRVTARGPARGRRRRRRTRDRYQARASS